MKTFAGSGIAMVLFTLISMAGVGLAQDSQKKEESASIQTSDYWVTDYIEQAGSVGDFTSIAFDSGTGIPWISYSDADNPALKVAHYVGTIGNCGSGNDWNCATVDEVHGIYSSIDIHPDTNPSPFINTRRVGVAYYDNSDGALKFAEYYCFTICKWDVVTILDEDGPSSPRFGKYAFMKYNQNGVPLIAFYHDYEFSSDELDYAYRVNSGGNCGVGAQALKWHCETVDVGNYVGQFISLDFSEFSGVYIAYYDVDDRNLKYAQSVETGIGNCGTSNSWDCVTVDGIDGSDVGKFASIHAPVNSGDEVQIAYYDATNGTVKYAYYRDAGGGNCGAGNFQCEDIEFIGIGLAQVGISLAVDSQNFPIIAYLDDSEFGENSKLKAARPATALLKWVGNCGPGGLWQCTEIDHGGPDQEEAQFASIAIDPYGLATIAYSELVVTTASNESNLKIARQQAMLFLPMVMQ